MAEIDEHYPHNNIHLFTMNDKVGDYNNKLKEQLPGEKVIVNAVDSVLQNHANISERTSTKITGEPR